MRSYPFHPVRKDDPLSESAVIARMQDIKDHGLKHAIVLFENQILVGRADYLACKRLNILPRFVVMTNVADSKAFVAAARARRAQQIASPQPLPVLPDVIPKEGAQEPISELSLAAVQRSPAARKQGQVGAVREYVRRLASQIGIRAAAREYGLKESRVLNWASRYGWHIGKRKHQAHNPVNHCPVCGQPVIIR